MPDVAHTRAALQGRNAAFRSVGVENPHLGLTEAVWAHGTDESHLDSVASRQHAGFTGGIQKFGPGFYVQQDSDKAESYARQHPSPAVQHGFVAASNPIALTEAQLLNVGRQFRRQSTAPSVVNDDPHLPKWRDADLGNIALRTRGHDFMHINADRNGDPIDVGVVLRPRKWMAMEDEVLPRE